MESKPFLVITGFSRSGTSFLARALNLSGVYLGTMNDFGVTEWNPDPYNLRGDWEHSKLFKLGLETLSPSEKFWHIPLTVPTKVDKKIGEEVKGIIQQLMEYPSLASGFKNPYVIVLFNAWKEFFPSNTVIAGIFRHPLKVAESFKNRWNIPYESTLNGWFVNNTLLLKLLDENPGFLLNFDWSNAQLSTEIENMLRKLGLPSVDLSGWYTENLKHSDQTFDRKYKIPDRVNELYAKLVKHAEMNNSNVKTPIATYTNEDLVNAYKALLMEIQERDKVFGNQQRELVLEKRQLERYKTISETDVFMVYEKFQRAMRESSPRGSMLRTITRLIKPVLKRFA